MTRFHVTGQFAHLTLDFKSPDGTLAIAIVHLCLMRIINLCVEVNFFRRSGEVRREQVSVEQLSEEPCPRLSPCEVWRHVLGELALEPRLPFPRLPVPGGQRKTFQDKVLPPRTISAQRLTVVSCLITSEQTSELERV